ncbi:hypothetical protein COY95_00690 [Candidatus Woesearchaeota archaeon CG_4_10_14_0_8_um_filter_47_5]|nr:MAG: hypothetical protein COY95_00690 [Candidatus Woesearchaeota archaeon CG_4_10_14_0_8_um_filter_47_5]
MADNQIKTEEKKARDDDRPIGDIFMEQDEKEAAKLHQEVAQQGYKPIGQGVDQEEGAMQKRSSVFSRLFGAMKKGGQEGDSTGNVEGSVPVQPMPGAAGPGAEALHMQEGVSLVEFEKLKIELAALKERNAFTGEQSGRMSEEVGELRAMNFQHDKALNEMKVLLEKLNSDVSGVEPEIIRRELDENKREHEKHEIGLNTFSKQLDGYYDELSKLTRVFKDMGDIKTLAELRRDITLKLLEVEKRKTEAENYAHHAEKMYSEISKRLVDFEKYKTRMDRVEEILKSMMQDIDIAKIKAEAGLSREEFESHIQEIKKEISIVKTISSIDDIRKTITKLEQEKYDLEHFIEVIKEDYKKGKISKVTYHDTLEANRRALKVISYKLQEIEKSTLKVEGQEGEEEEQERGEEELYTREDVRKALEGEGMPPSTEEGEKDLKGQGAQEQGEDGYKELKQKIEAWKKKGYDVTALEQELRTHEKKKK